MNLPYKIILAALLAAQNFLAVAQTTNALAPADYPKFITQRNIFDPNREPNVPYVKRIKPTYVAPVVRQADSFSLVGIIGYGEGRLAGAYAFFNGSSSQYQKTAQLNDSIATFKVAGIAADSVTLVSGTNTMVLGIGEQLHDGGGGQWVFANGTTVSYNNGNGRNGRNGFGFGNGGRRRNNNLGNNNGGNFNSGNFNRGRNNFAGSVAASDNSQADDQNVNSQDDSNAPDDNATPGIMAPSDNNNNAPDTDADTQDNTTTQQNDQSPDDSGDSNDPLAALKAARAAELQQIGH
jgi:hypothetical protein